MGRSKQLQRARLTAALGLETPPGRCGGLQFHRSPGCVRPQRLTMYLSFHVCACVYVSTCAYMSANVLACVYVYAYECLYT